MNRLSIDGCRRLISASDPCLTDEETSTLRDILYVIAEAVTECFIAVDTMDQALLNPTGDVVDCLNEADLIS
jgi:hypothetical protein